MFDKQLAIRVTDRESQHIMMYGPCLFSVGALAVWEDDAVFTVYRSDEARMGGEVECFSKRPQTS